MKHGTATTSIRCRLASGRSTMSAAFLLPLNTAGSTGTRRTSTVDRSTHRPTLPPGRSIRLASRGTTFVREAAGPSGAPVVILLHGWSSTADLTWSRSYRALAQHYRVLAIDHRGHGRGIRTRDRFRLEDCADDVVALADELGIPRFIPVGYSMGGPIASLVWRRHRERVQALVLCATSRRFNHTSSRRLAFALLNGSSALASVGAFRSVGQVSHAAWSRRLERRGDAAWTIEQVGRHDWPQVFAAGHEIGRFDSTSWIGDVDVPTAVVATLDDDVVSTQHQFALADAVGQASVHTVAGGHAACSSSSSPFAGAVVDACRAVTSRRSASPPWAGLIA